jgi:asparagine synthase (glutamine-hydrolysing)
VTVALGGDGSDELFAGYDPFRALKYARLYSKLVPRPVHEGLRMLMARLPVSHRNMSVDFRIKRTLRGLSYRPPYWIPVWMAAVDPRDLAELFDEQTRGDRNDMEEIYSEAIEQWEACATGDPVDRALQFYTKLYLQDDILVKADRASMMVSLEVRCPFLDAEFVDFVRRIPASYKFRDGQTKYILKKALEPLLPREILHRSKKGFGVPIGKWFREGDLKINRLADPAGLNPAYVARMVDVHLSDRSDERAFLWNHWLYTGMRALKNLQPAAN